MAHGEIYTRYTGWDPPSPPRPRSRSRHGHGGHVAPEAHTHAKRSLPKSKQGQRWWHRDPDAAAGALEDGQSGVSFVGSITDLWVPVSARGRILGDRGSNVRKIVEVLRIALGHEENEHGRAPFVHFKENDGWIEFELELYPPFNNEESFQHLLPVFRDLVKDMAEAPIDPGSRHCLRPPKIQPDDWECPNKACGNLCFARRKSCPLCGTAKPKPSELVRPSTNNNISDRQAEHVMTRLPKHQIAMVSTAERLGRPPPGECQVLWLVPQEHRGWVVGKDGATINWIKQESGAEVVLTNIPETRRVDGSDYVLVFVRGRPERTREAVRMISEAAGGYMADDGFEPMRGALMEAMRQFGGRRRVPLSEIVRVRGVKDALAETRCLMDGAGLRNLLEIVKQWPKDFKVRWSQAEGAEVELAAQDPDTPPWREPGARLGPGGRRWDGRHDWRRWSDRDEELAFEQSGVTHGAADGSWETTADDAPAPRKMFIPTCF